MQEKAKLFSRVFVQSRKQVPAETWLQLVNRTQSLEQFADILRTEATELNIPEYLHELARLEFHIYNLRTENKLIPEFTDKLTINPTLQLIEQRWKNLASQVESESEGPSPTRGNERIIIWRHPIHDKVRVKPVTDEDLLAMKMALEELSVHEVARQGGVHDAAVVSALIRALDAGIVIGPEPGITRDFNRDDYKHVDPSFFAARIFSLQWHITQACDLHCRHCYDRSQYTPLSFRQEIDILDDFKDFCSTFNVHGQVTFTGGNPLLHRNFEKLYQEAADRGFTLAILGNPTTSEQIERLQAIQPLAFYQVSLEGLEGHNDYIRGKGHFTKVLHFLDLLRELGVFSMVMLTLTRDNMDQVLELGEILRTRTDLFTFNRLSQVGEGANLAAVEVDKFPGFLRSYSDAVATNSCLGIKDNLFNILYHKDKHSLFGGCTGFGCGAAFNFITVLADGSVHACRKFPSPLGNIVNTSLREIYLSEAANLYRQGAAECRNCPVRPVCGGCLAVGHGHNLNIFQEKDPYCFIDAKD